MQLSTRKSSYSYNWVLVIIQCKYAFSYNVMNINNPHKKILEIFAIYIFGLKCCLHP